ncbi:MAG: flavodoxin [Clostridia bacterium]|nr:flavodoxin [Clostridia bacterium]
MNKKLIALFVLILLIVLGVFGYLILNKNNNTENQHTTNNNSNGQAQKENDIKDDEMTKTQENTNKKIAVIYFSATGTTKTVAEYIKDETNGDIIEIIPKEKYTSDDLSYNNDNSRTSKEQNDKNSRPEIENSINVDEYDVIFLGYPIWWGDTPRIIQTFMESVNLSGKTVIPFCTSGSSGISVSEKTLKSYNSDINWIEGKRLGTSKTEVINWVNSLNY